MSALDKRPSEPCPHVRWGVRGACRDCQPEVFAKPFPSRLPSGEWRCTGDHRTEPCGECGGCREVQGENALAARQATVSRAGRDSLCPNPLCRHWLSNHNESGCHECPCVTASAGSAEGDR